MRGMHTLMDIYFESKNNDNNKYKGTLTSARSLVVSRTDLLRLCFAGLEATLTSADLRFAAPLRFKGDGLAIYGFFYIRTTIYIHHSSTTTC
jgi:hypothetical protein